MNKPLAIDLFCGAGGMSEGILQAGFHIVYSSDINEDVEKTYTHRHETLGLFQGKNTYFQRKDIRELPSQEIIDAIQNLEIFKNKEFPQIDAIFGGPPCQGFSRAGLRKRDDPRNMLFKEYLRIINDIRPNYVVMENVEGFTDARLDGFVGVTGEEYPDNSLVPDILQQEFSKIKYKTLRPEILDASNYGVPQRRKRVIFIAYAESVTVPEYPTPTTPNKDQKVTVKDAISDLVTNANVTKVSELSHYQLASIIGRTPTIEGKTIPHQDSPQNHDFSNHNNLIKERFSLFQEGESTSMLSKRLLTEGIDLRSYPMLLNECLHKLPQYAEDNLIERFRSGQIDAEMMEALLTKKVTDLDMTATILHQRWLLYRMTTSPLLKTEFLQFARWLAFNRSMTRSASWGNELLEALVVRLKSPNTRK